MLEGERGGAAQFAMRVITRFNGVAGAERLIPVSGAHIDACLYHGQASTDFVERLLDLGGHVSVPTTLNVGSIDLLHPTLSRAEPELREGARRLMRGYTALGARPTWTCAPYQETLRPAIGDHVAWAESNAIVFANSVLGARTERYGDFFDTCAAIVGRVPYAGLHVPENRRATVMFDASELPARLVDEDLTYPLLGYLIGGRAGSRVPVLDGLPAGQSEDRIKALGAAAASSGALALIHIVGSTPEAPTVEAATQGRALTERLLLTKEDLREARRALTTAAGRQLDAVCLGTPHFSINEFRQLAGVVQRKRAEFALPVYVSTSRHVLAQAEAGGIAELLRAAGGTIVVDTCTYVTPILGEEVRVVMTNSAKWAYYAPANLGVGAILADLETCVASAVAGRVVESPA